MKFVLAIATVVLAVTSTASIAAAREIEIKTEKVGEVVHWKPDNIEVTQGETVKITAKHDLEGGFDFHGLFVPELKITEKVDRHKPLVVERKIPDDMKPGVYKIGCHFHPKHAPATLTVKAASKKAADKTPKS